eukprot:CAMPEP_0113413430 /NCGR_PEP_ID=MMETSP0013_2-20120614/23426_1 /TAXON_ID=2843 ORGANISM="Skeletonema costatum, Strain 1716" /NCGR_SAMPLE_ID=MMETSP0013_2 /ASSEMBLY_ACC=CAM_ASM_000158 /LENGTH=88 /DNA_ID=CAMNT_0000300113 /DNA_START=202 /DNA_END=468 /DNA_ORIENTATION=- /assembly_acc=CAM_ASM_000158
MAAKTNKKQKGKSDKPKEGEKPQKIMVPRRKLQNVPDLLSRGPDGTESEPEPIWIKLVWISFLILLFYFSLEYFLKNVHERGEDGGEL